MTRVIKIKRKFRVHFNRSEYHNGHIEVLAEDAEEAEDIFFMMEDDGDLESHDSYWINPGATIEYQPSGTVPVETTQER